MMRNIICMQVLAFIMSPRPRATGSKKPARERILDAALEEFGMNGFDGATTKVIAKKAEVNEVTLFRHFDSKLKLFEAVMMERSLLSQVGDMISFDFSKGMDEVLYRNMRNVLGLLRRNRHMFLMMVRDSWRFPELRELMNFMAVERGPELVAPVFQRLMEEGTIRKMDPVVAVRTMMGMVQAYFITEDLLGSGEVDEAKDERMLRGFVSILLDGLRRRE